MERDIVIKAFESSNNKTEFAANLGFHYINGKIIKQLNELAELYDLNFSLFNDKRWLKKVKYQLIQKCCPVCSTLFETQKDHPKEKTTCSFACSNIFYAKERHSPESRRKTSATMTQRIIDGDHPGWVRRTKEYRSWAERFVEKMLNDRGLKRGVDFEIEYRQYKWFIDFAFLSKKIALEIDGSQHLRPENQARDRAKDAWLTANGWTVIRIPWKRVDKKVYEELSAKIDDILLLVL